MNASTMPPLPAARRERGQVAGAVALSVLAVLVGLVVLAWAILFVTKGRFLKHPFERYASKFATRKVTVGGDFQLYFAPFNLKFVADKLTVTNPAWAPKPYLWTSDHFEVLAHPLSFVFGKKGRIDWIELTNAQSDLEWEKAPAKTRRNTWTLAGPTSNFTLPDIRRAQVSGTQVTYVDPLMQIRALIGIDTVRASDTQVQGAITFHGDGSARGKPFTLNGGVSTPNQAAAGGRLQFALHATSNATFLDVSGTLPGVTQFEGADLRVGVHGQNLARLFDLAGIVVPDTRAYRIGADFTKDGDDYRFTHLTGIYGDSDIEGGMTFNMPDNRPHLVADLASRRVDIVDLAPFIGYNPNTIATKGVTASATTNGGAKGRILPDAPLRIDALSRFDAHVSYKVGEIKAPHIPISDVALTFDLDHLLLKLEPLTFTMSGGHVTANVSINARNRPVETAYDIRLSTTPMGRLLAGWGLEKSGTTGSIAARIKMTGEGDTVRQSLATSDGRIAIVLPQGTFWVQYTQLAEFDVGVFLEKFLEKKLKEPVDVNCGLIAFTVRDGVAAADPILIDTTKNVILGRGNFSFRDESLDLMFRGDAKKISLFSGQSPFGIKGHFASPSFQIVTPQLLERGGAAVALGVAAGPAALLAFVDPGDAKAAACGPVLAAKPADQQLTTKGQPRKDVGKGSPKAVSPHGG